jgi:choline transport protein
MMSEDQKGYVLEESSLEREENGFEMCNLTQLGGTEADEHDMRMLGRTQQLNVRIRTI